MIRLIYDTEKAARKIVAALWLEGIEARLTAVGEGELWAVLTTEEGLAYIDRPRFTSLFPVGAGSR